MPFLAIVSSCMPSFSLTRNHSCQSYLLVQRHAKHSPNQVTLNAYHKIPQYLLFDDARHGSHCTRQWVFKCTSWHVWACSDLKAWWVPMHEYSNTHHGQVHHIRSEVMRNSGFTKEGLNWRTAIQESQNQVRTDAQFRIHHIRSELTYNSGFT